MNTVSIVDKIWKQLDGIRYAIWDDKTQTPIYMDIDIIDERENPEYMIGFDKEGRLVGKD